MQVQQQRPRPPQLRMPPRQQLLTLPLMDQRLAFQLLQMTTQLQHPHQTQIQTVIVLRVIRAVIQVVIRAVTRAEPVHRSEHETRRKVKDFYRRDNLDCGSGWSLRGEVKRTSPRRRSRAETGT